MENLRINLRKCYKYYLYDKYSVHMYLIYETAAPEIILHTQLNILYFQLMIV